MGLCESSEERYQRLQNEAIEKQLYESGRILQRTQKLLLLGAAEGGKSTILKQMRILHDNGFSTEEIHMMRRIIRENMLESMRIMLTEKTRLGIVPTDYRSEILQINSRIVREQPRVVEDVGRFMFSSDLYDALKQLWSDKAIQEVYSRRTDFHLLDSTKYFFDDLDRIAAENYEPNNLDVLLTRAPTLGVTETKFTVNNLTFRVFDVGGQRSERRKWIHCFDNVNAIIFITAVSEFDQKLMENNETARIRGINGVMQNIEVQFSMGNTPALLPGFVSSSVSMSQVAGETIENRLLESLSIFKQIVNNTLFSIHCSMILFLNKTDLFAEKIKKNCTINSAFPTYTGPTTYEAQIKFIQSKFETINENLPRKIYSHRTCATDTRQVETVIKTVFDTMMSKNLNESGMR